MKRCILLLITFYPLFGYNQTAEDSLLLKLDILEEQFHDSIYHALFLENRDINPAKSVQYAYKHLENTLKYHDLSKQVISYRILGTSLYNINEFDSAEFFLEKAYKIADNIGFKNQLIKITAQIGALYFQLDNYKKSVKFYLQFLDLSKEKNISHYIATGYNNLGLIYYRIGDHQTALKFYLMCLETKQKDNLLKGILYNYYNIGLCYIELKKFNVAIGFFEKVIESCKNCNENNLIEAYYGIGKAFFKMEKYNEALKYLEKSSKMAFNNSNYPLFANSNSLISEVYIIQEDFNTALGYLNKIKEIDYNYPYSIDNKIMLLYSNIYEKSGDFQKALNYKNKYIFLKDSVFSDKKVSEVKNLLIDYQLSENEEIIRGKNIQIQRNRHFVYMFGVLLFLLSIVLLFAYRNIQFRIKMNDKLSSLVYQRTQDLNSFFYRTSHDLAGPVATIKGLLGLMSIDHFKNEIENFVTRMDMTNRRLEKIVNKLNAVSKINSKRIDYEYVDVESLIFQIINEVKNGTGIQIDVHISGDKTFKTDKILIHAIFYNILMNSFQHIDHRETRHEVKIDIKNKGNLFVEISDNGKGIEMKYTQKIFDLFYVANDNALGSGLGLYQARLAAQRLNGDITLLHNKKPVTFGISIKNPRKKIIHLASNSLKT